tara:strand:+ start:8108 stop:10684 length:2577 start_codon:yes stop_codon:yes gene_type:complete
MVRCRIFQYVVVLVVTASASVAFGESSSDGDKPRAVMPEKHGAVFRKYCLDCHDSETQEGKVDLETISFEIGKDIPTAERWAKILNAINSGEMPPKDAEPISDVDKTGFLKDLSIQMVVARKILSDAGGVITMRRLNRREYANTIEALLGGIPDVSNLPDDQATSGFDTTGASLFFSSDQLEQYLATARASLELAVLPRQPPASRTVRIEPEDEYTPHYAKAAEAMRDTGKRARAFLAQKEKPAAAFGLLDEYQAKKQQVQEWLPLMDDYLARPETKTGATLIMTIKQGGYTRIKLPVLHEQAEGQYTIRVRAAAYPDAEERLHYLEFTSGYGTGRERLGWRKVSAPLNDPEIVEFKYEHRPGQKLQLMIHQRSHQDRGDKNLATIDMKENGIGTPPGIWVDWAEITGPEPVNRHAPAVEELRHVLAENDLASRDDNEFAREVLQRFATRAFRNEKPDSAFLDRLVLRYAANRTKGQSRTEALLGPLSIVLASPSFLYMVESTGNESSPSLTDRELAVRLSYFLWSAPPDEDLLSLANSGKLSDPAVLKSQTSRLLGDQRVDRFVRGFVHQWLEMERLGMFQFDGVQFRTFDNAARESAREEVFETVHTLLDEKLPLRSLLKADFVVVNDLLAGYYGIPGVDGHEFRQVKVPDGSLRGGLLGSAAVLAMGSDGQRSSLVERGAWVLRHLLNDPPPPAPPNVPMLSRLAGQVLSARELGKAHQEEPQCAQCHQKIDPIGFGLENFDASGQWRDLELIGTGRRKFGVWQTTKTFEIDSSGQLPGGQKFKNYFELRDAISRHEDSFSRGFTESLIAYGLGRPFGFTDQDLADEIMRSAKQSDYEISQFIHALIQSKLFQTK